MEQISVTVCMDEDIAKKFSELCDSIGITTEIAFNIFARKAVFEQRIPFEVTANKKNVKQPETVAELLGCDPQRLTKNQRRYFDAWAHLSDELIRYAYEAMIDTIGKVSFPYMNKILENWQDQGWKSVEEVKKGKKQQGGK